MSIRLGDDSHATQPLSHRLVHLGEWLQDIKPEVPSCPTPVIEHNVRRAAIEACERGNFVRDNLPEIPILEGRDTYELHTPIPKHCIHSILSACLSGREIQSGMGDGAYRRRSENLGYDYSPYSQNGFQVPDRGFIQLTRMPTYNSRFLGEPAPTLEEPIPPTDPGALTDPATYGFTEDVSDNSITLSADGLTGIKGDTTNTSHLRIARSRMDNGIYYFEVEVTERGANNTFGQAVGLTTFPNTASNINHIGDYMDSVGYHVKGFFQSDGDGRVTVPEQAQVGDIIGVIVSISDTSIIVEYTLNGVSFRTTTLDAGLELFPVISLTGNSGLRYISGISEPLTYLPMDAISWDEGLVVTQADVDTFNTELAAYQVLLDAFNNQPTTTELTYRDVEGLLVNVSLKPERDAMEIPEVLFKDYYELIRTGALYFLMNVRGKEWSDHPQATRYKREFEIELNRARQGIDRNFSTQSQRIKPRRFF